MCGITGIISQEGAAPDQALIGQMSELLAHRGPDGSGIELYGSVGFAHRRLSIIDLACGSQPMWSTCGNLLLTYNGEIFNYLELRSELEAGGQQFRTKSDTEVILNAFRSWGERCFTRLNGQFAFALFDKQNDATYLVRDRMGEKPLYYSREGRELVFASELKPLLHYREKRGIPSKLCRPAMADFLALNYVPFDLTLVQGIESVTPGTFIQLTKEGVSVRRYWQPSTSNFNGDSDAAMQQFEALLGDSVRLRLRSDVPVGLFLSGGIDSTLIAHAVKSIGCEMTAFCAHFEESNFSELKNAELVSRKLGLKLRSIRVSQHEHETSDLIERLVYHGDEPLADSSALPVYLLSREAAREVKVALSGEGGDELFGGYLTYRATELAKRIPRAVRALGPWLAPLAMRLPGGKGKVGCREMVTRFLRNLDLPPGAAHFAWNGMLRRHQKLKLLTQEAASGLDEPESFISLAKNLGVDFDRPKVSQLLLADQKNYLANDILAKTDRMSMAHGLELRPPLMDYRLVEFSRSLPEHLLAGVKRSKVLPKMLLKSNLPWYPHNAKKQGFSIPVHLWFRGKLKDFADSIFTSEFAANCGIYERAELNRLWQSHLKGQADIGFELWGIMISILWLRRFKITL
ncbi:MAG: asparagine synthase (glutamine-hydrolyzing) [Deltaproteobacteria bacterium]|nr:asparagine synthase (glutamine-hydrolyzing) [Deltaproteobacteria bacterium]